jgi:hypothetical protein
MNEINKNEIIEFFKKYEILNSQTRIEIIINRLIEEECYNLKSLINLEVKYFQRIGFKIFEENKLVTVLDELKLESIGKIEDKKLEELVKEEIKYIKKLNNNLKENINKEFFNKKGFAFSNRGQHHFNEKIFRERGDEFFNSKDLSIIYDTTPASFKTRKNNKKRDILNNIYNSKFPRQKLYLITDFNFNELEEKRVKLRIESIKEEDIVSEDSEEIINSTKKRVREASPDFTESKNKKKTLKKKFFK